MRLVSARVAAFKSAVDTGCFAIEPAVTCLVGKNESGKTAVLEALYRTNPEPTGHPTAFQDLRDYPRRHLSRDRASIPDTDAVTVAYELDDADMAALTERFGADVLAGSTATLTRGYYPHPKVDVPVDGEALLRGALAAAGLDETKAAGLSSHAALAARLRADDPVPEAVTRFLTDLDERDLRQELLEAVWARMPRMLYFNEFSILPGEVSITRLQKADEASLEPDERTALALLRLAGVESAAFTEDDYEERKAALEAAANRLTDELFEYWSQNTDLAVDLDVDFRADPNAPKGPPEAFLQVRIRNSRHRVTLNFGQRSAGFVWFFSFLAFFSDYQSGYQVGGEDTYGAPLVLLLDEPGLGLHASAQHDLLRYIDERLAPAHQVIYTTHSPFMIEPTALHRVRTVEDTDPPAARSVPAASTQAGPAGRAGRAGNGQSGGPGRGSGRAGGTVVRNDALTVSRDTVFPLQAALGYQLSQTLFVAPDTLLVEGPSDVLYLQVLSEHLHDLGRAGLDDRWVLAPAGGLSKIPTFVSLLGAQLNVAVLLDVASNASQRLDGLVDRNVLDRARVVPTTDFVDGDEADIEDLLGESFYLQLLADAGIGEITVRQLSTGGRLLKRAEAALGGRFNHYRPAQHLQRHASTLLPALDDAALTRFQTLFTRVNALLQ